MTPKIVRFLSNDRLETPFLVVDLEKVAANYNALRAAMSGHLPQSEFTSERMYQVMELCVSCKACKAEWHRLELKGC